MSLSIAENLVVSMHYKLTDDDGNLLDSSENAEPLAYLHGLAQIVPGLEKELTGKVEGDTLKVKVEPEDAYGEIVPELIQTVDRSAFAGIETIEVGMTFNAQGTDGSEKPIVIKQIAGDEVTIDANHPLAGVVLHFEIEIVSVRAATDEELAHGHAH